MEGGTQLLGADKKDTTVSPIISPIVWCWADGYLILVTPRWQKQRLRLQLVQPSALKSSRHRAIMHQTMFLSPVQISVHISSFQPPY